MTGNQYKKQIVLGQVTSVHGVRGWLKVYSWTQPAKNIFTYPIWRLNKADYGAEITVKIAEMCCGRFLTVRFNECVNRHQAHDYVGAQVVVNADALPVLATGEYYWHQLEGMTVMTNGRMGGSSINLGQVCRLFTTGANDVMVVRATPESIDGRERLIPWIEDQVILSVNMHTCALCVDWDPIF